MPTMSTASRLPRFFAVSLLLLAESGTAAINLKGFHAYADAESVAAGATIRFHVSSEIPYRFRITKLGLQVDDRASDQTIHLSKNEFPAEVQSIHPGSYVKLAKNIPPDSNLNALTLECWVRPWKLSGWQGVITQHDYPENCGFGLFLNGTQATFSIGTGGEYDRQAVVTGGKLQVRRWLNG